MKVDAMMRQRALETCDEMITTYELNTADIWASVHKETDQKKRVLLRQIAEGSESVIEKLREVRTVVDDAIKISGRRRGSAHGARGRFPGLR